MKISIAKLRKIIKETIDDEYHPGEQEGVCPICHEEILPGDEQTNSLNGPCHAWCVKQRHVHEEQNKTCPYCDQEILPDEEEDCVGQLHASCWKKSVGDEHVTNEYVNEAEQKHWLVDRSEDYKLGFDDATVMIIDFLIKERDNFKSQQDADSQDAAKTLQSVINSVSSGDWEKFPPK